VDAVDSGVTARATGVAGVLSAKICKERREASRPAFLLDVSVELPAGVTILFGPSGAGKSTLLDCIAGLVQPDNGRIAIGERVVFDAERGIDVAPQYRHVAYLFQSLALFPHMTVEENVRYGLAHMPPVERKMRAAGILQSFRVDRLAARRPEEISGGEKQRVALARSLVTEPRVLLLDEPLIGLDAELKSAIVDDLRAWNAAKKIPILYVTHSRDEVDALGERVIALDGGKVVGEGTPQNVLDAPRRKRLAQAAGFENLLSGTVMDLREEDGVMRVRLGQTELEVPLGHARAGDRVRVAIRAGDILLAMEKPRGLSARNLLAGKIVSIEERGAIVAARVDCGDVFQVQVTKGAARELELKAEAQVWLVVKTHSCHLVEE
jgi:molybdate transport system ATP-binding protein